MKDYIICPGCGKKNEVGDRFCGNCGTRLNASVNHNSEAGSGPRLNSSIDQNAEAGKGAAIASLVLGILAVVCWFFGYSSILSVIFGVIGVALAGKAKNEGFEGGIRTAGFVLSLIGLIGGALVLVACVACVGSLGSLSAMMSNY